MRVLCFLAGLIALATCPAVAAQTVSGLTGPALVQSTTVTLDSSGNATWTFTPAFPEAPDVTHIPQAMDTVNPLICNYTARTPNIVTIHCWRTSLIGLLTGLLSGPVTGAQVNLIARYRPQ